MSADVVNPFEGRVYCPTGNMFRLLEYRSIIGTRVDYDDRFLERNKNRQRTDFKRFPLPSELFSQFEYPRLSKMTTDPLRYEAFIAEVVRKKAVLVYEAVNKPLIVDTSMLFIPSIAGPGIHTEEYEHPAAAESLVRQVYLVGTNAEITSEYLDSIGSSEYQIRVVQGNGLQVGRRGDHSAVAMTALACIDGLGGEGEPIGLQVRIGRVNGWIANIAEPKNGWDSLFQLDDPSNPESSAQTVYERGVKDKNKSFIRAEVIRRLRENPFGPVGSTQAAE